MLRRSQQKGANLRYPDDIYQMFYFLKFWVTGDQGSFMFHGGGKSKRVSISPKLVSGIGNCVPSEGQCFLTGGSPVMVEARAM